MIEKIRKIEKGMIFSTVITLLLGIILTVYPTQSLMIIASIIGIALMVIGALFIIDYVRGSKMEKITSVSFVVGVLFLAFGLFLFIDHKNLVDMVISIIGLVLFIKGLCKLQMAFNFRGVLDAWKYNLLVGLLTITISLILLLNPDKSAEFFLRVIGIFVIFSSFAELAESIWILKDLDAVKDADFVEKKQITMEVVVDDEDEEENEVEESTEEDETEEVKEAVIVEEKKAKRGRKKK